jgi:hypothetical protein
LIGPNDCYHHDDGDDSHGDYAANELNRGNPTGRGGDPFLLPLFFAPLGAGLAAGIRAPI